jgi:hypothetical protein
MATLDSIWGMYRDMKDQRRQREQDDFARDKYDYGVEQDVITNDYRQATLANTKASQAQTKAQFEANEAQRGVINTANEAAVDLAANTLQRTRAQGQVRSMVTGITQMGGDADKWLAKPGNMDVANQMVMNSPSLLAQVQNVPGGENYAIAGIRQLRDAEGNPRYALMINTGQIDQEGNPILKPLSEARGKDDAVVSLGGKGTVDYIEQAILADTGSTRTQNQNSMMTLGDGVNDPNAQGVTQNVEQDAGTQTAGTQATTSSGTDSTDYTQSLKGPAVDPAVRYGSNQPDPNAKQIPADSKSQSQGLGEFFNEYLGLDGYEGLGIAEGVGRAVGSTYDHLENGASVIGNHLWMRGSQAVGLGGDVAAGFLGSDDAGSEAKPKPKQYERKTTASAKPSVDLTNNERKGVVAAPGAIEADNGVAQAHLNKSAAAATSIPTEAEVNSAHTLTTVPQKKVDTSSSAQRKRADALLSLKQNGNLITMPSAEKIGMFVKTGAMSAPTTQVTTFGDWDEKVTKNGLGQITGVERVYSSAYKTRMKAYRKEFGAAAAKTEELRVAKVNDNWNLATIQGAAHAGGPDKDDKGKYGNMIGSVSAADFDDYFRGFIRTNAQHVQAVLPTGMNINKLTGSNGELGILTALASATAQAIKEGTWSTKDIDVVAAGDWMQALKRYPPAKSLGIYVFQGQIHSVDFYAQRYADEKNITLASARAALHTQFGRNADIQKKEDERQKDED